MSSHLDNIPPVEKNTKELCDSESEVSIDVRDNEILAVNKIKDEELALAEKENRAVWYLRIFTTVLLLLVAVSICLAVFLEGRSSEEKDFEEVFK